jgi:hypothetical protein
MLAGQSHTSALAASKRRRKPAVLPYPARGARRPPMPDLLAVVDEGPVRLGPSGVDPVHLPRAPYLRRRSRSPV